MPEKKVRPYSLGETFPSHEANGAVGVATLIEIVVLPDNPEERERLIQKTLERYKTEENIGIISGKNLADDPKLAPRVNQNALYIFEQ